MGPDCLRAGWGTGSAAAATWELAADRRRAAGARAELAGEADWIRQRPEHECHARRRRAWRAELQHAEAMRN